MMGSNLRANSFMVAAVIIFGIGFTMLFLNRNLIKKIIGFNFMDSGVFLFLASGGYIENRVSPIIQGGETSVSAYINPVPAGLVLTGFGLAGRCPGGIVRSPARGRSPGAAPSTRGFSRAGMARSVS